MTSTLPERVEVEKILHACYIFSACPQRRRHPPTNEDTNPSPLEKGPPMRRAIPIVTGETYHIYSKSIYGYIIFTSDEEYQRMLQIMRYNLSGHKGPKLSEFLQSKLVRDKGFDAALADLHPTGEGGGLAILAYCLMPTHIHLIARQTRDAGLRIFMQKTMDSYSQYFNRRHNRKGPLWQGRYGASPISTDEQLAEKIAYVHNNPVKDLGLVRPEDWRYSSANNLHPLR